MQNIITFPKLGLEFKVSRAAFKIGEFPIFTYGILITLGLIIAVIYGYKQCKANNLDTDDFFNMLILAIPVSIICARAYYVIFSWSQYKNDILSVFDIRSGGLAIYGGIIGAACTVIIYCRRKRINIGTVLDMLAVGLLIGQAIGRWGNFVNGEAFGTVTNLPWAMTIESDGRVIAENVHPTFLYESVWDAVGIIVLLVYKRHTVFKGEVFCGYMAWYGLGRMFIEGLRTDSLYLFGTVRVSQLLAVITLAVGIAVIVIRRRRLLQARHTEKQEVE